MLTPMSWLEIYVPLSRLDGGLLVLLAIWLVTVAAGFGVWLRQRGREQAP